MTRKAITQQDFFVLCGDVKNNPDLYKTATWEKRLQRAQAIIGKDTVPYNAIRRAAKATGVKLDRTGRASGWYGAVKNSLENHEQRLCAIEEALGLSVSEQKHSPNSLAER